MVCPPGIRNDLAESGSPWTPSQRFHRLARSRSQTRWVARPHRRIYDAHSPARYTLCGSYHFQNGLARHRSQIQRQTSSALSQVSGRLAESVGDIEHMNLISDGRPIQRWIVYTKYRKLWPRPRSDIQHNRDQVGFQFVLLINLAIRVAASGVEIPQGQAHHKMR